jgi:cytochrome c oxidase subunit 3
MEQVNKIRAKKMMLWFSMISISMTFAGLTSAYVVSKSRPDWLEDFSLPASLYWSTLVILLSSLTFWLALAIAFVMFQFQGFSSLVEMGYYFTGAQSNVTTSFLYVLVLVHLAHLVAGLIVLLVVITNFNRGKYATNPLGFSLAHTFWHFLGFLWVYLFLFLYFLR